jgi:hypothetical protein
MKATLSGDVDNPFIEISRGTAADFATASGDVENRSSKSAASPPPISPTIR